MRGLRGKPTHPTDTDVFSSRRSSYSCWCASCRVTFSTGCCRTASSPTRNSLRSCATEMGINRPLVNQYFEFIGDIFRGDLGKSLWTDRKGDQQDRHCPARHAGDHLPRDACRRDCGYSSGGVRRSAAGQYPRLFVSLVRVHVGRRSLPFGSAP